MSGTSISPTTILGDRGVRFAEFVRGILNRATLKPQTLQILLTEESLRTYGVAFTHISADPENNYEYLEFLGDSILNTAIVWYMSRRFSDLQGPRAVKYLARLKINLTSKKTFSLKAVLSNRKTMNVEQYQRSLAYADNVVNVTYMPGFRNVTVQNMYVFRSGRFAEYQMFHDYAIFFATWPGGFKSFIRELGKGRITIKLVGVSEKKAVMNMYPPEVCRILRKCKHSRSLYRGSHLWYKTTDWSYVDMRIEFSMVDFRTCIATLAAHSFS